MDFIKDWGMISGLAGLALGAFLYLFKEVISKQIFPQLTKKQSFTILITFMLLVTLVSAGSIVLYFVYGESSTQLTVFVTDKEGNAVLENEGRVNIPLGNRSLNGIVGANGRINFPDITSDIIGDTILVGLDAKGWKIPNGKNRFVFTGDPIQLVVFRDNSLGTIKGVVKNRNGQEFIAGASIQINADTVISTNDLGLFKIILPDRMRVNSNTESYELTVSKEGFKTTALFQTPNSPIEIRLEKISQ